MYLISLIAFLLLHGPCLAAPGLEEGDYLPSSPKHFTMYNAPSEGEICGLTTGPDGTTLYFLDLTSSLIGALDTGTGAITEYAIMAPHATPTDPATPVTCVAVTGKDDLVYFGASTIQGLIQFNPKTHPPKLNYFGSMAASWGWAADRGIYLSDTEANLVYLFNYHTHSFGSYQVNSPAGLRTDRYNNVWVGSVIGQYLVEISNSTDTVTEYPYCCPLPADVEFTALAASTENERYLWATFNNFAGLLRIDPATKTFLIHNDPIPGLGGSLFDENDYCGRIWISNYLEGDWATYYEPAQNEWVDVRPQVAPGQFNAANRGPGHYMWFAVGNEGGILRYALSEKCTGQPD